MIVAPFAGAWIEIDNIKELYSAVYVAPFAGAWIEIESNRCGSMSVKVAPFAGAWIEISTQPTSFAAILSHPSRVRGLKYDFIEFMQKGRRRTLRGCVD